MKRIIAVTVFALVCSVFLCSFLPQNTNSENKCLQFAANNPEYTTVTPLNNGGDNESDIKEETDKKLESIFSEFKDIVPEGIPTDIDELAAMAGIEEIISYAATLFRDGVSGIGNSFYLFFGIALLFCLSELLSEDMGESAPVVRAGAALVLSVPIISVVGDLIDSVGGSIADGSEFFSGIIPILSSVCALATGGLTAGYTTATMSLSLSFVSGVLIENLYPAATLIFVASLMSSVDTGQGVSAVAKGIRGWFNFVIGITSMLIVAAFGAQTFITAARDSVAIRGAKYAISGMIPVVGGTVSGTLTMLISGIKLLSGSIGIISVIVLLSFMGAPLLQLLFYRICIGACVILTSFSGASFGERFFSSLRSAIDCLIAVLTSSLLVFILEIIILTAGLNSII